MRMYKLAGLSWNGAAAQRTEYFSTGNATKQMSGFLSGKLDRLIVVLVNQ